MSEPDTSKITIRLGTRSSPLARWQADWVAGELQARGVAVQLVPITTRGDIAAGPIGALGGQGVFTKEIQRALLEHRIDLAVHSLKDLPTEPVPGLQLAAVPPREAPFDALVCREAAGLAELAAGALVGTGSLRRQAQLLHARSDLRVADIRGNVDTRLAKLEAGEFDAILLARAGLARLGLQEKITQLLPPETMLPAVGQGALGLETREDDPAVQAALAPLKDEATWCAVLAERSLLAALRGGCLAPVGAFARIENQQLTLTAAVLSPDGKERIEAKLAGEPEAASSIGEAVAANLLAQGAADLIAIARSRAP